MRILFICENYLPHYGGAEVVFKNLAEGYVQRKHAVTLITQLLPDTKKREVMNGVIVKRIFSFFSRYIFTFSAVIKSIQEAKQADVIQTTTFNGAFPAWIAAKIRRKPVVLTVHEVWIEKWHHVTQFPTWKCFLHESLEKLIYMLPFDRYICVSHATQQDLLTRTSVQKEKTSVIYNGIDESFWNRSSDQKKVQRIRQKVGGKKLFLYFSWGRPGESKGFEYLIQAAAHVKEKIPRSKLVLMFGSIATYRKRYQKLCSLIKELKLSEYILIIPSVSYEELKDYLQAMDCVIVPSISEGFGYSAIEATTAGIPVIVSNAGSLPEVVSGKHLIFESKNIPDLADNIVKLAQGKFNSTPLKTFPWNSSIDAYLKTYQEALMEKKEKSEAAG